MSTSIQSVNGMTVETRGKRVFINGQEVVDCKCGKTLAPKVSKMQALPYILLGMGLGVLAVRIIEVIQ